jgi:hypothetical protein
MGKTSRDAIGAFISDMQTRCATAIAGATVPFFAEQGDKVVQFGTGVLLEIASTRFLLTSAHVIDVAVRHGLPTFVTSGKRGDALIPLDDLRLIFTPMPESGDRKDDAFDICVAQLPKELADRLLPERRFVHLAELDPHDEQKRGSWYYTFGYPHVLSKVDERNRTVGRSPLCYGTVIYDGARGPLPDFNPVFDIALDYSPNGSTDEMGNPVTLPNPRGISGCGMWRLATAGTHAKLWKPEHMKLVGIQHTWDKELHLLRGTRIGLVIRMIYKNSPDLRPAIRLYWEDPMWSF